MSPATRPPENRDEVGLLVLKKEGAGQLARAGHIGELLEPGDVVVVNDAATFPASLKLTTNRGAAIELRLIEERPDGFLAAVLGAGDWRTDTDDRAPPPPLSVGDQLSEGVEVVALDSRSSRLVVVQLGDDPWELIYRIGRPIQYSYLDDELALWSVQTTFGSRPVAAEMPSAGRPFSGAMLQALRSRGVVVVSLTHATGLSATGHPAIDELLPLDERYVIPSATAEAVNLARGRVVAIGTTVVRALESAFDGASVRAGPGVATLKIDQNTELHVVDAIVTGLHEEGASHRRLLEAFADEQDISRAWALAAAAGFRSHELGDLAIVFAQTTRPPARRLGHPGSGDCSTNERAPTRR